MPQNSKTKKKETLKRAAKDRILRIRAYAYNSVHICGELCEQNGVWSRTERSGIEEETEHSGERACSGEARADCGRGAACLLAHLSVLNLYVVSATGSTPSHPPWSHPPGAPAEKDGESEKGTGSGKG